MLLTSGRVDSTASSFERSQPRVRLDRLAFTHPPTSQQERRNARTMAAPPSSTAPPAQVATGLPPTLLDHLSQSLALFPGTHKYTVQVLRSQPRRSYALFPHASNPKTKIWQEEVLVVLSEELKLPAPLPPAEPSASTSEPSEPPPEKDATTASLPIVALEASLYAIPSTSTTLLYISKIDTSGLSSSPSAARTLVSSFLSFHLLHPPHGTTRLRVHVFARAQGQYLFPGSVDNKEKRVLDDKGLLRWWKGCIALAASAEGVQNAKLYYLVPGLSFTESLPYLPSTPSPAWIYSHPYNNPSPLFPAPSSPSLSSTSAPPTPPLLTDLIPTFPDDPKSRYLHSLTSSSLPPSGTSGDYDDRVASLTSTVFATGSSLSHQLQREELERERTRERARVLGSCAGVEEWWEGMAWRQECCSGTLVGFFGIVSDGKKREEGESAVGRDMRGIRGAVPHAAFTKLWSEFHNVDYAWTSVEKLVWAAGKWERDVEMVVRSEGVDVGEDGVERECRRVVEVKNEVVKRVREVEEVKKVNVMVPRKKKKVEGN